MIVELFGITVHEFDVSFTDLLLSIESIICAWLIVKQKTTHVVLQKMVASLFIWLSCSSFFGMLYHAFFPAGTNTPAGFYMWITVALSIGCVACSVWAINAYVIKGTAFFKKLLPFIVAYMMVFTYVMFFVSYTFSTIIYFYSPPMIVLIIIALRNYIQSKERAWFYLLTGLVLTFVAAAFQMLNIGLHPVYFNNNAVYHVIQGIALWVIFEAFKKILCIKSWISK